MRADIKRWLPSTIGTRALRVDVVARTRSDLEIRAADADRNAPPTITTLHVAREITQDVLTGEFVGDLVVHVRQSGGVLGEEQPTAGLLGESAQLELRVGTRPETAEAQ